MDKLIPPTTHLSRNHNTHSNRYQLASRTGANQCRHFSPLGPQHCLVSTVLLRVVTSQFLSPRRRCSTSGLSKYPPARTRPVSRPREVHRGRIVSSGEASRSDLATLSSEGTFSCKTPAHRKGAGHPLSHGNPARCCCSGSFSFSARLRIVLRPLV